MSHEHEHDHDHGDHDDHGGHGRDVEIGVVVNGERTVVEADENAPLGTVIPKALEQTHNVGQPPQNWELHDAEGHPLDLDRKIKQFHFPAHVTLRLTLKAGIGG